MSEKTWKILDRIGMTVGLFAAAVLLIFFDTVGQMRGTTAGKSLIGIILFCGAFSFFVKYREKTGGVTLKTFWYTALALAGIFIVVLIVNKVFH
ncbi:hypothetical protein [Gracilibacillus xinjiangensis]|uniref:Uncharacterized protein n=1 Tax=Gracilibacillus xinjiangensis TaxID=1193282 RepID=A0ABV8WTZ9_9BACI